MNPIKHLILRSNKVTCNARHGNETPPTMDNLIKLSNVQYEMEMYLEQNIIEIDCPECEGSGFICDRREDSRFSKPCKKCNGVGKVKVIILED